jgi:hypothetical protein
MVDVCLSQGWSRNVNPMESHHGPVRLFLCPRDLELIILLVGGDVSIDSEIFLVTDFVNLKIKPIQSFRCAHKGKGMIYVRLFIEISARTCISICICILFFNKKIPLQVN